MSSGVISLSVDEEETPKKSAEEERQLSEFAKVLAEKYVITTLTPRPTPRAHRDSAKRCDVGELVGHFAWVFVGIPGHQRNL